MIQELLTEKLRPKELKHMILPDRIRNSFENGLQQNVLLAGSPGTGKTTIAKILMSGHPNMFINVSDESSVETIRTKIHDFASTVSIMDGETSTKVVVLDECLSENESVRIGSINDWSPIKLKDLEKEIIYPCISMNQTTGELENDTCMIISDKIDDIFEVELEDGRTIQVTGNHPFMIKSENGNTQQKSINDGLSKLDSICCF